MEIKKEELVQLTNEVYALTLLFPKKEPLRYKIRGLADDILANAIKSDFDGEKSDFNFANLAIMEAYLAVGIKQNWVKSEELLKVAEKYANLNQQWEDIVSRKLNISGLPPVINNKQNQLPAVIHLPASLSVKKISQPEEFHWNGRQAKILNILKQKEKAQVWEFKNIFPGVTKRTLRRDFEKLWQQKLIERIGEKNQTFYQVSQK